MPDAAALLTLLHETAAAVRAALGSLDDWGLAGTRPSQYHSDLAADEAALAVLLDAGVGVLSEESGVHEADREVIVVVDPLDGSTNAARGVPWYATSLCALDRQGALCALVVDLPRHVSFTAVRGEGAWRDGVAIRPSGVSALGDAVVALSGYPPRHYGWAQYRTLGAAALDLCAVATGVIDGFVDASRNAHGSWDYLGGMLVCQEAGATVVDAFDRDLVVRQHAERRTPVAGATPALCDALVAARRSAGPPA